MICWSGHADRSLRAKLLEDATRETPIQGQSRVELGSCVHMAPQTRGATAGEADNLYMFYDRGVAGRDVLAVALMGTVGVMVPKELQSLYLLQYGADAGLLSMYAAFSVVADVVGALITVQLLLGGSLKYAPRVLQAGVVVTAASAVLILFPPDWSADFAQQRVFLSHYYGLLSIAAAVGQKLLVYPCLIASLYILPETETRARALAYKTVLDSMMGEGITGALSLVLLANPCLWIKVAQGSLIVFGVCVSLKCNYIFGLRDDLLSHANTRDVGTVRSHQRGCGYGSYFARSRLVDAAPVAKLVLIQFFTQFVVALNGFSAAGAIYWSSVVGVNDTWRSLFISGVYALGAGVVGLLGTILMTSLYRVHADVQAVVPWIVIVLATVACVVLLFFGHTDVGALLGIALLYAYFITNFWNDVTFLSFLDGVLSGCDSSATGDYHVLSHSLFRDVAATMLFDLRGLLVTALLASTGFREPNCEAICHGSGPQCVDGCHASAHAHVSSATKDFVWFAFAVVTPAGYWLAALLIACFPRSAARSLEQGNAAVPQCSLVALSGAQRVELPAPAASPHH